MLKKVLLPLISALIICVSIVHSSSSKNVSTPQTSQTLSPYVESVPPKEAPIAD